MLKSGLRDRGYIALNEYFKGQFPNNQKTGWKNWSKFKVSNGKNNETPMIQAAEINKVLTILSSFESIFFFRR